MIKKSWNTQEIEYISANYKDKSLMEIASYLDRTEASVKLKIQRLGYSRNHDAYTEEERKLLSDNYSSMSTKELAKMLGRTENAVGTLARYQGLPRKRRKAPAFRHGDIRRVLRRKIVLDNIHRCTV